MHDHSTEQYLVFLDPDPALTGRSELCVRLGSGLYVCYSALTRSRFYHALKAAHHPARLLVAPLAGDPKFKGMAEGALEVLRQQARNAETETRPRQSSSGTDFVPGGEASIHPWANRRNP